MPKHLLCADDSQTMQQVVTITFAQSEYQVHLAKSAEEALALARQVRPDLVLADAIMPGKTGYDLCLALKSDPNTASAPVVIMCGNSAPYDEGRAKAVGVDGHVIKPWDTQVLLDKVHELVTQTASRGVARPMGMAAPSPEARPPTAQVERARPHLGDGQPLSRPPAGLPRPPLIRGVPAVGQRSGPGPASLGQPVAPALRPGPAVDARPQAPPVASVPAAFAAATRPAVPPRSPTIMGMPAVAMPPAGVAPTAPLRTQMPVAPAPAPAVTAMPASAAAQTAAPMRAPAATLPPQPAASIKPAVAEVARAVVPALSAAVVPAKTQETRGPEHEAIARLSREIIERIAWEVVPELAEVMIKQHLDKLAAKR